MSEVTFPAAINPHVHGRGFEQAYKETPATVTRAAVAGGIGHVGLMPNYEPRTIRPFNTINFLNVVDEVQKLDTDTGVAALNCDVSVWGTTIPDLHYPETLALVSKHALGNKWYVEITQGQDRAVAVDDFMPYASYIKEHAKPTEPIAIHVEDESVEEAIAKVAGEVGHTLVIPHINNRFLIDAVIAGKKKDWPVFAEVSTDHIFSDMSKVEDMGWRARMKPPLATPDDVDYLWSVKDWWDYIADDHAPHTLAEKDRADSENPEGMVGEGQTMCFGSATIEAYMPLIFTAFKQDRLTYDEVVALTSANTARIYGLNVDTTSTVTMIDDEHEFGRDQVFSKCGWNVFEGHRMLGRVASVDIHGTTVFKEGEFLDVPPQGKLMLKNKLKVRRRR